MVMKPADIIGSVSSASLVDRDEEVDKGHAAEGSVQRLTSLLYHNPQGMISYFQCMNSTRLAVLLILCLQNSMFTVLRRYSQGVLREVYSKVRDGLTVCIHHS